MQNLTLAVALALIALSEPAVAQLVPVEWDAAGQFSKEVPVAGGKFVEVCEKLPKRAKIAWSFDAVAPLDFNIHYHEGKKVRFPARKNQVAQDAGTLVTKVEQDYCWMWTNKNSADATLRLKLARS
ncbi:MAG: hypothetical protein HOQ10_00010 [Frateuria sp.]|nr:hypothetical protein [Frateuria sp.]